ALSATTLIVPAMAATADEEAVKQSVEALRKAILAQDKAKLETLTAEQLSYSHSDARIEDKAKFIDGVMTRKAVIKSIDFPNLTVAIAGNNAIVRHQWVSESELDGKVTNHQDRRPASLAETGQRLEAVGACGLQVAGAGGKILEETGKAGMRPSLGHEDGRTKAKRSGYGINAHETPLTAAL